MASENTGELYILSRKYELKRIDQSSYVLKAIKTVLCAKGPKFLPNEYY